SIAVPSLPAGAVVSSTNVQITFTAIGASFQSELRVQATPPATVGTVQTDLQPSSVAAAGTTTNAALGTWGTGNPSGKWLFRFRESTDDGLSPDANITNITITVNYTFPVSYSWSPSTGLSATNVSNPVASPTSNTTYTMTAAASSGCSVTDAVIVTVNPTSVGGTASSNQTICSGTSPANITLAGNTGNIQWQWATDAAFTTPNNISGATASPLTSAQMGSLTATRYYRAVVTSGVCTAANSNVITVTVNPTSVGGTASSNQTICSGTSPADITLAGNTGTIQWQWATDAAFTTPNNIAGATASPLTSAQMGTLSATRYYRAVVTSGVCTAANSNVITVTIAAATTPTVSIAASPSTTICAGTSVTFTATGANLNGTTITNYNFRVNAISVQSGASNTYTTTTLTNGQLVSCIITTSAGCVTSTSATSADIAMTVNAVPTAVTVSGAGTFCGSTTITASGGTGGTIYFQGTTPGGTSTTTASTSQTISASGTYYFRSRSAAGCWGPEGSAVVTISSIPAAPVSAAASVIGFSGFTANWAASAGATSYELDVSTSATFSTFVVGYQALNVGNVTTYPVTGLSPTTAYYYRVRALNTCGTSSNSGNQSCVTTAISYCTPTYASGGTTDN
ncbi:MAG: hypothetical protein ACK44B_03000, partial [Flavobacteriales bacterium]